MATNLVWTKDRIEGLRVVRDQKLYKPRYKSFVLFCEAEYGIGRSFAYALLAGKRNTKQQISADIRWEIWERDDFRCFYCGSRRFLSVDHKIPESKGGTLDGDNLITACMRCNVRRGTQDMASFLDGLLFSEVLNAGVSHAI